jgi:general secretion pathway protein A
MDYYKLLNLSKEPFSDSSDSEFHFHLNQHVQCLQRIELSVRMRRGLSVVIGDVGLGKTSLCRQLVRRLESDDKIETRLILDPSFNSPSEFLETVAELFGDYHPNNKSSGDRQLKKIIENHILRQQVDQSINVVLIIDEGEKLPEFCLEILREFLEYEVNEHKSLQIVIFAQTEFEQVLGRFKGLRDRIDFYHVLAPLNFRQTKAIIRFRIEKASQDQGKTPLLFGFFALLYIYRASGGYPRRIINLCHQMILAMIIKNRSKAGWSEGRRCIKEVFPERARRWQRIRIGFLACSLAVSFVFTLAHEHGKTMGPLERGRIPAFSQVIRGHIEFASTRSGGGFSEDQSPKGPTGQPLKTGRIYIRDNR